MARKVRRRSDRALRARMHSPGRPPAGRWEHRQRFWKAISRGLSSEDAGVEPGVSPRPAPKILTQSEGYNLAELSRSDFPAHSES